jgi:mRNA interferase RelE/StbE
VASYKLFIKASAAKEIEAIATKKDRRRVVDKIRSLADEPRPAGCRKLSGAERYRLCVGRYRILYTIEDDRLIVTVVKVGERKDLYRRRSR